MDNQELKPCDIRVIERHGRVTYDLRDGWKTLDEHWVVNGQRFYHEPTAADIEDAYTRAVPAVTDLDSKTE